MRVCKPSNNEVRHCTDVVFELLCVSVYVCVLTCARACAQAWSSVDACAYMRVLLCWSWLRNFVFCLPHPMLAHKLIASFNE